MNQSARDKLAPPFHTVEKNFKMAVDRAVKARNKRLIMEENRLINLVCTAVAEMNKAKGVSRQSIVKFVLKTQQKTVTNEVNRALRKAVTEGLLLHTSGSGLNGSFVLRQDRSNNLQLPKRERVKSKEAKIRKLSTDVAAEFEGNCCCTCENLTQPRNRQRKLNLKMSLSVCKCQIATHEKTSPCTSSTTTFLHSILKKKNWKRRSLRKSISKFPPLKKKRKVRFKRTPEVVLISPRIRRVRKTKRRQSVAL